MKERPGGAAEQENCGSKSQAQTNMRMESEVQNITIVINEDGEPSFG